MIKKINLDTVSKPLDDLLKECGLKETSKEKNEKPLGFSKKARFEGNGHKIRYDLGVQKTTGMTTLTAYQERDEPLDRRIIGFCRGIYDGDTPSSVVAREVRLKEHNIRKYLSNDT